MKHSGIFRIINKDGINNFVHIFFLYSVSDMTHLFLDFVTYN